MNFMSYGKKWRFQATFQWMVTYIPQRYELNRWAESHLSFKDDSILDKAENADGNGRTLQFCSSGCVFCREREYSPESAFIDILTDKRHILSVILQALGRIYLQYD